LGYLLGKNIGGVEGAALRLGRYAVRPVTGGFRKFIAEDEKWGKVIRAANIKPE
jgi:hypothetical protein